MAKRANGEGTIRKRSDGRWEGRYVNPITNKRESVYGKTQKIVKEKINEISYQIYNNEFTNESNITLSEWIKIWYKEYTMDVKPLTLATYERNIRNHIEPQIGHIQLKKLSVENIQKFYNFLAIDKGLSAKTIKNIHGILHRILEQAIRLNYIKCNNSELCTTPRIENREIKPLEDDQVKKFLKAIQGDAYAPIYFVTLFTGMRQGEVLGLTWDNVDFNHNIIHINKQLVKSRAYGQESTYYFGELKNNKPRTIFAPQCVMDVLRIRKKTQAQEKLTAGDKWIGENTNWKDLVFTNEIGIHLVHCTVYKHYKKIVKQLGIETSRFHDLRHSFAVISLQNGDDIKTVQEALGHYSAAFTLQTYAHATQKMKSDSANRMDMYVNSIENSQ